jgi:hypothetical protein
VHQGSDPGGQRLARTALLSGYTDHSAQPPRPWQTLELAFSGVLELDPRAGHEVAHGA